MELDYEIEPKIEQDSDSESLIDEDYTEDSDHNSDITEPVRSTEVLHITSSKDEGADSENRDKNSPVTS